MKTIKQIEKEIKEIRDTDFSKATTRERNSAIKRLEFLNIAKDYLNEEPRKELLEKQLAEREVRWRDFYIYLPKFNLEIIYETERHKILAYETHNGLKLLKAQIKALKFILND